MANTAQKDEKDTKAPDVPAALTPGEHNPFLEGLILEGVKTNEAIAKWYEKRDQLRTQGRAAVDTGFCSKEQAQRVTDLWPKRTKKEEAAAAAS